MTLDTRTNLDTFPKEREERLKEIYRYSLFETMLYRSNNWMHEYRVSWIAEEVAKLIAPFASFDAEKVRVLGLVHDDAEIITGDIQAGHKAQMTSEQLAVLDENECTAVKTLAERYPKEINGYSYEELLMSAIHKDSIEGQIVSYADKFDAYCEGMHEFLGGNTTIITSLIFYARFFAQVREKLPLLKETFEKVQVSPFIFPFIKSPEPGIQISFADYARFSGKPHTKESIRIDTLLFPFYDAWKKLVIEKGKEEGESWLLEQREFIPAYKIWH